MNLQVPPELEAKVTGLTAKTGRTIDQVALDLLASSVDMMNGAGAGRRTAGSPPMNGGYSTTPKSLSHAPPVSRLVMPV